MMPRNARVLFATFSAVAITLTAGPAWGAVRATDPGLECGQTITGAVHLDADLHCASDGLTLSAGASLDLGGHSLIGPAGGRSTPTGRYSGIGITVPDPRDVTVTNGTIRDWKYGVRSDDGFAYGGTVTITHVIVVENIYGLWADWTNYQPHTSSPVDLQISDSTFVYSQDVSLELFHVSATVLRSYFKARRGGNGGVRVGNGVLRVYNSTFQTVLEAVVCYRSTCGFQNNVVRDGEYGVDVYNDVRDPADPPLTVNVDANRFTRLVSGIRSWAAVDAVRVTNNRFRQTDSGVLGHGASLTLSGNDISQGREALSWSGGSGVIENNVFRDNIEDGVYIPTGTSALSLGANTADDNGGYGIYAPGVTDLGGNTASGNGDGTEPQCVGVVCD